MKSKNVKKYDMEERTFLFAKKVIEYVRNLPRGIVNSENCYIFIRIIFINPSLLDLIIFQTFVYYEVSVLNHIYAQGSRGI